MSEVNELIRDARLAFEARDRDRVVDRLRQLVDRAPPLPTTWGPLARMAGAIGEASLSIAASHLHCSQAPNDVERKLLLATTLSSFGKVEQSINIGSEIVASEPDHPGAHHNLGVALIQMGRRSDAEAVLRRSIALKPYGSPSWLPLSTLLRFTPDSSDFLQLRSVAIDKTPAAIPIRGSILYALAKALDDCGDVDQAFATYNEGARLIRSELPFEENESARFVDELRQGFDQRFLRNLAPSEIESDRPIFVFGLPRSGTTLMEQILVAHSEVSHGGELGLFRHAAMALERFAPFEIGEFLRKSRDPSRAWTHIGETYLRLLQDWFGDAGRIVDKSLSTPSMLGVIAHVFPNARFVWMKRDIAPVAWSCFKTRFAVGQNWSWSLPEIAAHFRFIDGLYDHWTELIGDRILTVPYEGLVENPNDWIPRVLQHVGLQDEAQTRRFYEVSRVVQTASSAQVRRPLYKGSGDAWQRYRTHMQPFFDTYDGL